MDTRDTIVVAGIGRSGTTWLGDLINYKNEYRILFEPMHLEEGIGMPDIFYNPRYFRPDDKTYVPLMNDILVGRHRSAFTDKFNTPQSPEYPILMKEVRANLMLKWMQQQFPGLRIVYILRHPGAVIHSHLELGWGNDMKIFQNIPRQPELLADHLAPFLPVFRGIRTPFEGWVCHWCAMQYVLLRQFKPGEMHWMFYENLVGQPLDELRRLFDYLKKPLDESAMQPLITRASKTTFDKNTALSSNVNRSAAWQTSFSAEQIDYLYEMLELFGIGALYSRETLQPNTALAREMLASDSQPQPDPRLLSKWRLRGRVNSWIKAVRGR